MTKRHPVFKDLTEPSSSVAGYDEDEVREAYDLFPESTSRRLAIAKLRRYRLLVDLLKPQPIDRPISCPFCSRMLRNPMTQLVFVRKRGRRKSYYVKRSDIKELRCRSCIQRRTPRLKRKPIDGRRVREQRISLQMTMREFAEECGWSFSTQRRIESGQNVYPNQDQMENYLSLVT